MRLIRTAIFVALTGSGAAAMANDWPQLGYDGARGRATNEVSGGVFHQDWKTQVSSASIVASPAVADGFVVVAAADGRVRVLRADDGGATWSFDAGQALGASPAVTHGRVYVPTLGGHLLALRLANGALVWDRALGGQNYGSPALSGGSLVLATGFPTQQVVRIDEATGSVQWQTAPGVVAGLANSSPAIDGGQIVFGMNNGRYQSLDLATGSAAWTTDTKGLVNMSTPLLLAGTAFFVPGGSSAAVHAVDRATGAALPGWPVTIADPQAPAAASVLNVRQAVSSPVSAGTMVIFQIRFEYALRPPTGSLDTTTALAEYVVAVDVAKAGIAWQRPLATRLASNVNQIPELSVCPTPALFVTAEGPALVAASSLTAKVVVVDGATGAERWTGALAAPTRSSPVLANGQLFVATENGVLHAFGSDANRAPAPPVTGFAPAGGAALERAAAVLRWDAAQDAEGTDMSYVVRVDADGEILESWLSELTTNGGQSAVTLPKGFLRPATTYTYAVRSRDPAGALSAWSAPQTFTTALTPDIVAAGTAYDTIDDALAAAPAGTPVRLGAGVLRLTSPVQLPPGGSLIGAGPQETVLDASGLSSAIEIGGRGGPAELKGLTVAGAWVGIKVGASHGNVVRNVVARDNVHAGIEVDAGGGAEIINATLVRNGTGAAAVGWLAIRNSIITDNETGLARDNDGVVTSRYNDLYGNSAANYRAVEPGPGDLSVPVAFAGEARHDYRLAVLQPTTDRGDPEDEFTEEPAPNGGRVNIGAFGNTPAAERTAIAQTWHEAPAPRAQSGGCSVGGAAGTSRGGVGLLVAAAAALAFRRRRPARARGPRRVMVLGAALVVSLLAAPAFAVTRVQYATAANKGETTVTTSWPAATTGGNLLVAIVAVRGGSGTVITPPLLKGWTLATRADNGNNISTAIYYSANASAQSGASTWTLVPGDHATLSLIEYGGAAPGAVLDKVATATGSGTAPSTGTTATTTQASEVAVGGFSVADTDTFSGETNGFAEVGSDTASSTSSPSSRNNTVMVEKLLTATGAQSTAATLSGNGGAWAGAVATFKTAIRYWIGGGSDCSSSSGWSLSSGGANNTGAPDNTSIAVFDGGGTASCTLNASTRLDSVEVRSGYTGTVTLGSSGSLTTTAGLSVGGGTLDASSGSVSIGGAGTISGGTFKVGTGTQTFTGGLTVASGAALNMTGAGGKLQVGTTGLTLNGTLTTSGSGSTIPRIDSTTGNGNYPFTVGSTAILNVDGLRIDHMDANGMNVTRATFRVFKNVQFRNTSGGTGSTHMRVTANALELYAPGCYFDGSAAINVQLVGNGDADGQTRANFEFRTTTINGAHAGESYDVDDDSSPRDGVGDHPTTNGAVIQWLYSVTSDTAGTVEGFPTAAFDWNNFTWYGVYVAFRDVAGAGTTDRIYVRTMDGDAAYSYDIPESAGNIIGTPRWDTVNEVTLGVDVNGDGDTADSDVRVVYIPTTAGKIYKLIDTGTALTMPGAGSTWSTPFSSATVATITSALISDGTNLYFGGTDNSTPSSPRVFGVQIARNPGEKTLAKNIAAAGVIDVAPAWKIYNGTTYLYIGSTAVSGQAYIYRMDVAPGASINAQCLDAKHDVNGSVRVALDKAVAGDAGGRVHRIDAASFSVGGFANTSGFPFRDTTNHTVTALDAGNASIMASPYIDPATGNIYFGDKDGHLYALAPTGTLLPGFPIQLTTTAQLSASPIYQSGVIMIGGTGGNVYYVDQKNASNVPEVFRKVNFGAVAISSIAYNASKGQYMAATSNGQLFFITKYDDPTPTSN